MRTITQRYRDPLSEIWLRASAALGLTVVRTSDAYAATDGAGTLRLAIDAELDADDSLGQMIFHEICHWLVQGDDAHRRADWGLNNESETDFWREHACLRLQAVLTRRFGLAALFAPTTDFRETFWKGLPADVLADRQDMSVRLAIEGLARADKAPFAVPLMAALRATQALATAVNSVGVANDPDSMWSGVTPAEEIAAHPAFVDGPTTVTLHPNHASPALRCGGCAWRYEGGPGRKATRCRQADGNKIDDAWAACERFEAALPCQQCGACCRAAYGAVYVGKRDPFVRKHPSLIVKSELAWEIKRDGDHCAALQGGNLDQAAAQAGLRRETDVACIVYDDRPATCRAFTAGSDHCLTARRRLGFSL
ncbi:MAG: YkgJ family cysteine cluster protein [Myxococcales bacterium]|nr:YkgJ family cysteine cluster protein [Myxococcales bacterium]